MCSYNRINNTYACENKQTLGDFKGKMGFQVIFILSLSISLSLSLSLSLSSYMSCQGWMMSDWGATHSTVPSALAGLDQQMPDDSFFGKALAQAISSGQVSNTPFALLLNKTHQLTPPHNNNNRSLSQDSTTWCYAF